jgi:hypothetical protein
MKNKKFSPKKSRLQHKKKKFMIIEGTKFSSTEEVKTISGTKKSSPRNISRLQNKKILASAEQIKITEGTKI